MKYFEKVCGECGHWEEQEITSDLQRVGVCRHSPPILAMIPTNQGMVGSIQRLTLPASMDACGQIVEPEQIIVQ